MTTYHAAAIGVVVGYALLCWLFLKRGKPKYPDTDSIDDSGNSLLVAFASQSGQAEQLARQCADALRPKQSVMVVALNQVDRHLIEKTSVALFFVSTYGDGEPPDNALRFDQQWLRNSTGSVLSHLQFAVLALGDSQYQNFCGFGTALARGLRRCGANPLFDTVTVDCLDPGDLSVWQQQLNTLGLFENDVSQPAAPKPGFNIGRLVQRTCLNAGSPGEPAWLVQIEPPSGVKWQAGDILEILPYNDPTHSIREYSIASLFSDGSIELLVRQACKAGGGFGLGSGWLTRSSSPGGEIAFRIRANPVFHEPVSNKPMVLIGNGTGMAGLRVHLKARVAAGARENCLFFGERTHAHDFFFRDEIERWQEQEFLPHLHLAFSRDQREKHYVQDLLLTQSALILDWTNRGAAIFVCGSLEGMAGGVDAALQKILGSQQLLQMKIEGRYARDVY